MSVCLMHRKRAYAWIGLICAAGFGAGLLWHHFLLRPPKILFEPSVFIFPVDAIENDVLKAKVVLRNDSRHRATIDQVIPSCGCSQLLTEGGELFRGPMDLQPGEALPLDVFVDTRGQNGHREVSVTVNSSVAGQTITSTSLINYTVRVGSRVQPEVLTFHDAEPGSSLFAELDVFDSLPDPGVQFLSASSSSPERIGALLEPIDSAVSPDASHSLFKRRYRLYVTFVPVDQRGVQREVVVLQPLDAERAPVKIPIICTTQRPRYELIPSTVVLARTETEATTSRVIECRIRNGITPCLVVIEKPGWVNVSMHDRALGTKQIVLECKIPERGVPPETRIVFGRHISVAKTEPVVELPIKLYRTD